MHSKSFFNKTLLLGALLVCVFGAAYLLYFIYQNSFQNGSPFTANSAFVFKKEKAKPSLPARFSIPSLGVDAVVESVGITPQGAVGVPVGVLNVGWLNASVVPGEIGTAVLDGHSGYKDNKPAIFDNIGRLVKGSKIYIKDSKGGTITFVVQELKSYGKSENVNDVFVSHDNIARLNLITCAGDWNPVAKTHSKRLVVFATREI